jgi:V/A-type H+-transporting ATPase subunit E
MSLAQITDKIKSDAQKEADELLAKATSQAEQITKRAQEECDVVKSDFQARFDKERPEIFRRREIVAGLDVKKMMLKAQRGLISDVYGQTLDKLSKMDGAQYTALCEAMLDAAVKTKDEELQVSAAEKHLDQAWLDGYNAKHGTQLRFSEVKPDIAGGFILSRGKINTNCSWDMLVRVAQEKQESDVVKRLFPAAE